MLLVPHHLLFAVSLAVAFICQTNVRATYFPVQASKALVNAVRELVADCESKASFDSQAAKLVKVVGQAAFDQALGKAAPAQAGTTAQPALAADASDSGDEGFGTAEDAESSEIDDDDDDHVPVATVLVNAGGAGGMLADVDSSSEEEQEFATPSGRLQQESNDGAAGAEESSCSEGDEAALERAHETRQVWRLHLTPLVAFCCLALAYHVCNCIVALDNRLHPCARWIQMVCRVLHSMLLATTQ